MRSWPQRTSLKGWGLICRAEVAVTLMESDLVNALPAEIMTSYCTIYGIVKRFNNMEEKVLAHREITLQSTSTRKKPNAFVYLWQIKKMMLASGEETFQRWNKIHTVGQVLCIGMEEARAAVNLATAMPEEVVERLQNLAAKFGMGRAGPINHGILASPLMCLGKGPVHAVLAWQDAMANTEDTLTLLVDRLEQDWLAAPVGVRKSPTLADLATLQARCAAYIINLEGLRQIVSEEIFTQELPKLEKKFKAKYPPKRLGTQLLLVITHDPPSGVPESAWKPKALPGTWTWSWTKRSTRLRKLQTREGCQP